MIFSFLRRLAAARRKPAGLMAILIFILLTVSIILSHHLFLMDRLQNLTNLQLKSDRLLLLAALRVASSHINLLRYLSDDLPSVTKALEDTRQAKAVLLQAQNLMTAENQEITVAPIFDVFKNYTMLIFKVQEARIGGENPKLTRLVDLASKTGQDLGRRIEKSIRDSELRILEANQKTGHAARRRLAKIFFGYAVILFFCLVFAFHVTRNGNGSASEPKIEGKAFHNKDLESMIPTMDSDELSAFAGAFNDMAQQLCASYSALEQREVALAKERNLLRTLINNLPDHIYVKDMENRYVLANTALIAHMGLPSLDEAMGKKDSELFSPASAHLFYEIEQEAFRSAKPIINKEIRIQDESTNNLRWYAITNVLLRESNNQVTGIVGLRRNITDTKLLQDQLLQSERLASTGQLAASIAHEINSPLQGIVSLLSSMERAGRENEKLLKKIYLVKAGLSRIKDTVKNLLDLNRPGKEEKQLTNVNRIILDTAALVKGQLKQQKIMLKLDLMAGIPNILASPQQLGQVFMNLLNNSIEAIVEAYKVQTEPGILSNSINEIRIQTDMNANHIIIAISDTGHGIAHQHIDHVFDPFFTKKKKMGMGVGLSICHNIIGEHHGTIACENTPEGGALFSIRLPLEQKP
jgi:PAS domain S-box-containing protein